MNKYLTAGLLVIGCNSLLAQPIFEITPIVHGQATLVKGQQATYIYQITNSSGYDLTNIGLVNLALGTTAVPNSSYQNCTFPLSLSNNASCVLKVTINTQESKDDISGGPKVCYTGNNPIYCSVPFKQDQIKTSVTPGPISYACDDNIANFNYELSQNFDSTVIDHATIESWGPARNLLLMEPELNACKASNPGQNDKVTWMQKRIIAAYEFWVAQKINYCHHHVPDFATPLISNGQPRTTLTTGGYCSAQVDMMPGSFYYGQAVRWNYSGTGSETLNNWINNNQMWYGVDCSDFTSFMYDFAFAIEFNSDTGYQAGQATDGSQDNLTPNGQTAMNKLRDFSLVNPQGPAGVLICKDGQTEAELSECGGYGNNGYFSAFLDHDLLPTPSNITNEMLTHLLPGDLLFLGFKGHDGNNPTSMVTHVITWTGKKVGYGANDIDPKLIAPEEICPNDWQPKIGDWVIIDSHYQGPDYRVFSDCFYRNNIWGARRVIGYM